MQNNLKLSDKIFNQDHEQIVYCSDKDLGLKAIIGIHDTTLGPSIGGTRMWNYSTEEEGLKDVLRLSKAMSLKSSLAGLNAGGGKAVIIGDLKLKNQNFIKKYASFINDINGKYWTAQDVNISSQDMIWMKDVTPFVVVMLVLLIIFMVTAPLLTVGVQVDLPESAADSLPDDQEPLTISVNSKGEIFIQEHQVSFNKIIPKLLAIAKNRTDTRIYVRGDKNINYGRILEVMGRLSGAGFSKVALISEPYKN